ncbi:ATP-binding protein [Streptomyces sp. B1I3]|uniref:ATP-binding protein n=1 Tax=Streptomyces sp. B1I3 TaxID=3042264 RepID=UPI00277D843A|nr:ATP-binding protein [Streptomyces sp. B1I3]MDQ0795779.1 anti-sigma regulatory factor (Ser/Thr protein kinase) [Streptomyces sp. B1I3]
MNGERDELWDGGAPADGPEDAVGPAAQDGPAGTGGVPRNAAAARDAVTRLLEAQFCGLGGEGPADVVVADALLVTSELVTNAVRHGGGLTGFRAEIIGDGLLLTVTDASTRPPVTTERDPAAAPDGGYGWLLVRRLAKRVAITYLPDGKHIVALVALV